MPYVIGLDVGGTKIEGILAKFVSGSKTPKILEKIRVPTESGKSRNIVLMNIVAAVVRLNTYGKKNCRNFRLFGIGIGIPGFFSKGKLEMVPNIPCLKGFRLKDELRAELRKCGIKSHLRIENDSACFALAEHKFGAARNKKNVLGIILGTGVGGGIIVNNRLYLGRDGAAGHVGHFVIDPSGPSCGCGQRGDFESWCSGTAIVKRYLAASGKIKNPDPPKISISKERVAKRIVAETFEKMGTALAGLVSILNPEIIVLGGGVSNRPASYYKKLAVVTRKHGDSALLKGLKIVKNRLGDSAGVFGAAALALGTK